MSLDRWPVSFECGQEWPPAAAIIYAASGGNASTANQEEMDAAVSRLDRRILRPRRRAVADPGAARRMARDRSRYGAARSRRRHVARTAAAAAGVGDAERAGGTGAGDAGERIVALLTDRPRPGPNGGAGGADTPRWSY